MSRKSMGSNKLGKTGKERPGSKKISKVDSWKPNLESGKCRWYHRLIK